MNKTDTPNAATNIMTITGIFHQSALRWVTPQWQQTGSVEGVIFLQAEQINRLVDRSRPHFAQTV